MGRAFEALEELRADQAYHLSLAVFNEAIDGLVGPVVVGQGIIHGQGEERFFLGEGVLDHLEQPAVGLFDGVVGDLRIVAGRKECLCAAVLTLALPHVGPAALDHEVLKEGIAAQNLLGLCEVGFDGGLAIYARRRRLFQVLLHLAEMAR